MTEPQRDELDAALDAALDSLVTEYSGVFAREAIAECLTDSFAQLQPARIRGFLPLLAHRFARERLNAAVRTSALGDREVPRVLFVCTHNSGRSQIAAALLETEAAGRVTVASAGTTPAPELNFDVVTALAEIGVATADLFPKPLTDEVVNAADVVITMGCGDSCPVIPGRRYIDWDVADPANSDLATVRTIRDDIANRVEVLLAELEIPARVDR